MKLELRALKPNPMRDFKVDPIDPANVEELRRSIKEDGFWGGVVVRRHKDGFQIACGHHRVEAAIKAGLKDADLFVLDRDSTDDGTMVRIYARENATQRGNTSAAAAGSVAAAIRFIAKVVFTGEDKHISKFFEMSQKAVESLRGNLSSNKGMGEGVITDFLARGMPDSFSLGTVREHLASLKMSGDYARIVGEVRDQIHKDHADAVHALEAQKKATAKAEAERIKAEAELKAANERLKTARDEEAKKRAKREELEAEARAILWDKRKVELEHELAEIRKGAGVRAVESAMAAATAADGREVTFDLEGVAKHLTNENHLRVFRQVVTGQGITPYLAVNRQAALAKALVRKANELGHELSGAFIRENIIDMVLNVKARERAFTKEEKDALRNKDFESKFAAALDDFCRHVRGMNGAGIDILSLIKRRPEGSHLKITGEFRSNLSTAKNVISRLAKEF